MSLPSSSRSKQNIIDASDSTGLDPVKDKALINALKHIDTFYEKPPPGMYKTEEEEERPEDTIPDLPENQAAREFLAKAPRKGLWMPLGKEVKVMQCWRCKQYGHRTGDKECPLFLLGNASSEIFRYVHEDPMYNYVEEIKIKEKEEKVKRLRAILEKSDSSDESSSLSSSSSSSSSLDSTSHKHTKRKKKSKKSKKHEKSHRRYKKKSKKSRKKKKHKKSHS